MTLPGRISFVFLLLSSSVAWAAPAQISCPATIGVGQQLTTPVAGWKAGTEDLPHRLASVTFFDGPPGDNASLVNDTTAKTAGKEIATWRFSAKPQRPQWISCSYSGTSITLSRILPSNVTSCSVTYNPRQQIAGSASIEQINCK